MFFDSHTHLDDRVFDNDREEVLSDLHSHRVGLVMNVGCDEDSSERSAALAEKYPFVYAAVGSHPDSADTLSDASLELYRSLSKQPKVKAIGEIGLDYHYETVSRDIQKACFERQLALAQELSLPVIVHEREAHADAMDLVRLYPSVTGVFHCYSGAWEQARELVNRGWYIGFTGVLTFKNARKAIEVATQLPLERILIETDSPYMAPEPHRGRRNDSRYVPLVGQALAAIRGLPSEEIEQATYENACRLFGIEA